jgi:peroxiredoxin
VVPSLYLAWIAALAMAPAPAVPLGREVGDLGLGDGRLLVVAFVAAECPLAELYAGRLAELAGIFGPKGVAFVAVASNRRETDESLDRFAAAHGMSFPIRADRDGQVAARLGATRTPSVVVLDERRVIRYRGRIDDQYSRGTRRAEPRRRDLAEALEALLAGRAIDQPETEAIGCPIDRPETGTEAVGDSAAAPVTSTYNYEQDVAPILRRRCVACHSKGQIAPFALSTYRQASGWAEAIAEAVEDRRMPPWHADPAFGTFANDSHLPDDEIRILTAWARGGHPRGAVEPIEPPLPVQPSGDWSISGPDVVFAIPQPFHVPAQGIVDYQQYVVDPGFREDRWIAAAEIQPGNRAVVHHCTVFLTPRGVGEPEYTPGALGSFCLAAMAPGTPAMVLPPGMAKRIPAGWRLVFVIHYTTTGTPQSDQTRVGLTFAAPADVRREVATRLLYDPDLRIPPHAPDHRVEQSWQAPDDLLLLAMFPHMHLRGKSFRYEASYPDGTNETLLFVPHYDFNWQNRYVLAKPKRIPAGTTLRCIAHYDNSAANLANPDPNATVHAGKQSSDEMFNGYFDVALVDQDLTQPGRAPGIALPRWVFSVPMRLWACLLILAVCGLALHFVRPGRGRRLCR